MLSPSPPQETDDEHAFSISLTVYSKIKKMSKGKITSKEEKSTKTKELIFAIKLHIGEHLLWFIWFLVMGS